MSERIALLVGGEVARRVDIPDGPGLFPLQEVNLVTKWNGDEVVTRWAATGDRCLHGRRVFAPAAPKPSTAGAR